MIIKNVLIKVKKKKNAKYLEYIYIIVEMRSSERRKEEDWLKAKRKKPRCKIMETGRGVKIGSASIKRARE